jgi:hypothetical protein
MNRSDKSVRLGMACAVALILLAVSIPAVSTTASVFAQSGSWTEPVQISDTPYGSWFPDLVVDNLGNVHVVWCETSPAPTGHREQVFYTMWDGQTWSEPNDIVPPSPDIIRNAIATDELGYLHMMFSGSVPSIGHNSLFYTQAPIGGAWSAAQWSTPHRIGGGSNYAVDIAVSPDNTIHAVYDQGVVDEVEMEGLVFVNQSSDIFYRRSTDGGATWSAPVNLFPSPATGSAREQIEIDEAGTIHVAWDEGWDKLTGRGDPNYSVYTSSSDGGLSWRPPISVTYPTTGTAQLTPASDGRGGVVLLWRLTDDAGLYYQWSDDDGSTWFPPARVPGLFTRSWRGPFDLYDMAADSAGHIHLVVVAAQSAELEAPLAVYHLEWDGTVWAEPEVLYAGAGYPEYPRIAVSRGNQLHVVWFVREELFGDVRRDVWYTTSQSAAPLQTPPPFPTPNPSPTASPAPALTPLPVPSPSAGPIDSQAPSGLDTDSDDVVRVALAVAPVPLILLLVLVYRRARR